MSGSFFKNGALIESTKTTVTAAGTTTLTASSESNQQFTGTTTQNVALPDATTLSVGRKFRILNRSTGIVTVKYNGGTTLTTVAANTSLTLTLIVNGTTDGTFDADTGGATGGGTSSGLGQVTIGPSGSGADYITSGTNDQTVFTSAEADTKITNGGTILILAGTYTFGAAHTFVGNKYYKGVSKDHVTITLFDGTNNGNASTDLIEFSGITFTNTGGSVSAIGSAVACTYYMHDCVFTNTAAIVTNNSTFYLSRVTFSNGGAYTQIQNSTIHATDCTFSSTVIFSSLSGKLFADTCTLSAGVDSSSTSGTNSGGMEFVNCSVSSFTSTAGIVWTNCRFVGCSLPTTIPTFITGRFEGNTPLSSNRDFFDIGTKAVNFGIDWTVTTGNALTAALTLGASVNMTGFTGMCPGRAHTLKIIQDGTGGRTLTWSGVTWISGSPPVLNSTAGAVTFVTFFYDGSTTYGYAVGGAVSPLTTKGDTYTYDTANARHAAPGDYGFLIPDSGATDGWRSGTYLETNGRQTKNYLQYADFENNATTGWTLGTTGTLTNALPTGTPSFGSGAAGTLALSIASSGQLSGTRSLSYASSAATTVGNMVASSAYAIDASDQSRVLSFKFNYKAAVNPTNGNFSGTSTNSFAVAVWDVTNSAWIQNSKPFNLIQTGGVGSASGTFQTAANTASIRLVVYNANASTGAITMFFDDFFMGPGTGNVSGQNPTRSVFTTGTSATYTTPAGAQQLKITVIGGGGGGGGSAGSPSGNAGSGGGGGGGTSILFIDNPAATYTYTVGPGGAGGSSANGSDGSPSSFSTAIGGGGIHGNGASGVNNPGVGGSAGVGSGGSYNFEGGDGGIGVSGVAAVTAGSGGHGGNTFMGGGGQGGSNGGATAANGNLYGGGGGGGTQGGTGGTGGQGVVIVEVLYQPVGGGAVSGDGRVIVFQGTSTGQANKALASTAAFTLTSIRDTHGGFNGTDTYKIPVSGYYTVLWGADGAFSGAAGSTGVNALMAGNVIKNGNIVETTNIRNQGTGNFNSWPCNVSYTDFFFAGDAVTVNVTTNFTTPGTNGGGVLSIAGVAGSAITSPTDTVYAKYYASANTTSTTTQPIDFAVKIKDTHNAVTTGASWQFKAPISGTYSVTVFCNAASGTNSTFLAIYKNGAIYENIGNSGNVSTAPLPGVTSLPLLAGETIDLRTTTSTVIAGNATQSNAAASHIEITKTGN